MARKTSPVIVELNCEANPSTQTIEYDRDEWDAMTPSQRAVVLDDEVQNHMANCGGGGWYIEDPDDETSVGDAPIVVRLDVDDVMRLVADYGTACRETGPLSDAAKDLLSAIRRTLAGEDA